MKLSFILASLFLGVASSQEETLSLTTGVTASFDCTTEGDSCCLTGEIGTFSQEGTATFGENPCSSKGSFDCTGDCTIACNSENCNIDAASSTSETMAPTLVGASYCTFAPDTTCYPSTEGWPACCGDETCGNDGVGDAPPCEETALVGASYCTFAPDTTCYPSTEGWPACCSDESCENDGVGDAPACEDAGETSEQADDTEAPETSTESPSGALVASYMLVMATMITNMLGLFLFGW